MRALLLAASVAATVAFAAPASACCHVYEVEASAGPCAARWTGDAFGGTSESVGGECTVGGTTVGHVVEQCVGFRC